MRKIALFCIGLNLASMHHMSLADSDFDTSIKSSLNASHAESVAKNQWHHCANDLQKPGTGSCAFSGLRQVRYGNDKGWTYSTFFNGLSVWKCKGASFPKNKTKGKKVCEYSNKAITASVTPPKNCANRMDCMGMDTDQFPSGVPGYATSRTKADNNPPKQDTLGAFRIPCALSHFSYDDPLVHPNKPGDSHLHAFFGNTAVTAHSTAESITNTGNSTCSGGLANRSGYWVPALINGNTKLPKVPSQTLFYYKGGYKGTSSARFKSLPKGLAMIGRDYSWSCKSNKKVYDSIPTECSSTGEQITLTVIFPQCWDGKRQYTDDGSHMRIAKGGCPKSHPETMPEITMKVTYKVEQKGEASKWRLASDMDGDKPGSTAHADWMNGWDPKISQSIADHCLNAKMNCGVNSIGNGLRLY